MLEEDFHNIVDKAVSSQQKRATENISVLWIVASMSLSSMLQGLTDESDTWRMLLTSFPSQASWVESADAQISPARRTADLNRLYTRRHQTISLIRWRFQIGGNHAASFTRHTKTVSANRALHQQGQTWKKQYLGETNAYAKAEDEN